MTSVTDEVVAARIGAVVQQSLDRRQPRGYRIEVQPEGVLQEDDWYHVVVRSTQDVRTYDFYDVLAEAEAELQDQQHLNILLVPAVGD
jgi:heat shock protein HspQ